MADSNSIGNRGARRPCPLLSTFTKRPSSQDTFITPSPLVGSSTSASSFFCLPSLSVTFTTRTSSSNTSQQITIALPDSFRGLTVAAAVVFGLVVVVVVTLANSSTSSSSSSLLVLVVVLGTRTTVVVVVVDLVVVVVVVIILVGVWTGPIISTISLIDIFLKKTTTPLFLHFCTVSR